MLIRRDQMDMIKDVIVLLGQQKFDVQTQYKLLKIKRAAQEEEELYQEQIMSNCEQFFELGENNQPIISEQGGYKIKKDKIQECNIFIAQMKKVQVQIPDIYFTIDEIEKLNLTLEQMEAFMPFIK